MRRMKVLDLVVAGIMVGEYSVEDLMNIGKLSKQDKKASDADKYICFNTGYENVFFHAIKRIAKTGLGKRYESKDEFVIDVYELISKNFPTVTPNDLFRLKTNTIIYEENMYVENNSDTSPAIYEEIAMAAVDAIINLKELVQDDKLKDVTQEQIDEYKKELEGIECIDMKWN